VPGELYPVLLQYGQTCEARAPKGKVRASSSAVLKLPRAACRTKPVFGGAAWGLDLCIVGRETGEGSRAQKIGGGDGGVTSALIRPSRFRLRYSRIQAALCAGSR